jgi:hypothetical protein
MDRLRLPASLQAKIGALLLGLIAFAQTGVLKKPNTFTLLSLSRQGGDTAAVINYEIPFDGVVELRILGARDSVVYFFQWPSLQGKRQRRLPGTGQLKGTYRYRITYKGRDYEGQVTL